MRVVPLLLVWSLLLTDSLACAVQSPERLTGNDVVPGIWGVVEMPQAPGPHPAVILLHGSAGWHPWYAEVARSYADFGFVALALDYYAETGGAAIGSNEKIQKWPTWMETVQSAVAYLRDLPAVSNLPVGLVGFSRGAFLAVSVAGSTPGVYAVVDFYGGGGGGTKALEDEVENLPALLIFHGAADEVVPVRFAQELQNAVLAENGRVETHIYSNLGHAFAAPYASTYSETAAQDAFRRAIAFLRIHLRN